MIRKGEFLFLDGERALCLSCADFDHLEYLPRGDAALTRRAKKYSGLSAVVVRFSRSRARYAPTQWPQPREGSRGMLRGIPLSCLKSSSSGRHQSVKSWGAGAKPPFASH